MDFIPQLGMYVGLSYVFRSVLDVPRRDPEWDKIMKNVWIAAAVWFALSALPFAAFLKNEDFANTVFYAYLLATFYRLKNFKATLLISMAMLPIMAVHFASTSVQWLAPGFYEMIAEQIKAARNFSVMWMIGFGIYAVTQNNKERKIRRKEEERLRIAEERRNQLEHLVAERTEELTKQKNQLEQALDNLKAAQAQLVQSEKMASLGELTAGIAHEIQNPLNFVNNFSELSVELAQELREELDKPDMDKGLVLDLVNDLVQNQEKINHHGKRAAGIVSGMLQHSRSGTGKKEPTDINALADEYLRLAYHGLRAKNKDFNAKTQLDLDPNVGIVDVVSQDLGRVLLNLINKAFYAVTQKKQSAAAESGFEPTVTVSTRKTPKGDIEIRIQDNGTGIPETIRSKIFQPFFTTKPTGQGTGLGLSLTYDIVTKGHGGTIDIETREGEGTTFILHLPTQ